MSVEIEMSLFERSQPLSVPSLVLGATFLLTANGCSLALEQGIEKCHSNSDCTALGSAFANSVCDTERGLCLKTSPLTAGCTTNAECIALNNDEPAICRKTDHQCVPVLSDECPQLLADARDLSNDNAILVGTVLGRTGVTAAAAAAFEDGMELARSDFNSAASGLPPATTGGERRPLVLINCDEAVDPVKAANHLVDLGVPAIIGAYYSSSTIKIANEVTIPNKVLLVSPASNSPLITTLDAGSPRLLWRTVPSDVIQGSVVPQVVSTVLEPAIKTALGQSTTLRVAIVHRGDAAGVGISTAVIPKLSFNGAAATSNGDNFLEVDYGNPLDTVNNPDPKVKYAEAAAKLASFKPHLAIAVGATAEVITDIFGPLEASWTDAAYRPHYLLANNTLQNQATLDFVGSNANLRRRVLGHMAGASGEAIDALKFRFNSSADSTYTGGVPFAYDAVYLVAYGIVANGSKDLTGPNLAASLSSLLPPATTVGVGINDISTAFTSLTQGKGIDLNGVSGPMNFDPATGDAESDVQVWCVSVDSTTGAAKGFQNSGLYYSAKDGALAGAIDCP